MFRLNNNILLGVLCLIILMIKFSGVKDSMCASVPISWIRRLTANPGRGLRIFVLALGIFLFFGTTDIWAQSALDSLFQQTEEGDWVQTARVSTRLDEKRIHVEAVSDASASERFLDSLAHALKLRPNMEVRRSPHGPRITAAELVERGGDNPSHGIVSANRAVFQYRFTIDPEAEEPFVEQIESIQFYADSSAPADSIGHGKPLLHLDSSEKWVQDLLQARIPFHDLAPTERFSSVFRFTRIVGYNNQRILTIGGQSVTNERDEKKRRAFVRLMSRVYYWSE